MLTACYPTVNLPPSEEALAPEVIKKACQKMLCSVHAFHSAGKRRGYSPRECSRNPQKNRFSRLTEIRFMSSKSLEPEPSGSKKPAVQRVELLPLGGFRRQANQLVSAHPLKYKHVLALTRVTCACSELLLNNALAFKSYYSSCYCSSSSPECWP
jgi:hypothetical protein